MTEQELCTQYELIIRLLKKGDAEEVIEILENAIKRIDKGATSSSQSQKDE